MLSIRVVLGAVAAGAAVGVSAGLFGLCGLYRRLCIIDAAALQIYEGGPQSESPSVKLADVLAAAIRRNMHMARHTRVDPVRIERAVRTLKPSLQEVAAMSRGFDLSTDVWRAIVNGLDLETRILTPALLAGACPTLVLCLAKRLKEDGVWWDIEFD